MLAGVTVLGGVMASGASSATVPNLPWTELLPPLPSPSQTERVKVKRCRKARLKCVRVQIERMKRLRDRLGCDHRAVFATTYLTLTRQLLKAVKANPHFFRQPKFFFREDALFANFYFDVIKAWNRGEPVPEAWRIAFETAGTGDVNAAQDMLLGINAHVQNDMPFVLAALGLRNKRGASRKPDHDKANQVLNAAYEPVVQEINRRYDPIVSLTNSSWHPIDDVAGLEVVRAWRELVWRNAERLVNADSAAERTQIARQIELNAALQAHLIALVPQPGYPATRDAYCEQQLAG
jgi:Family of unknown function (DUF5995)